jgi:hypothetical protein
MGMQRDAEVEEWQQKSGLRPSEEQRLFYRYKAFALIKVIELERSGIRDGDGRWYGLDPISGIARELADLILEYELRRDAGVIRAWDNNDPPPF